MIKSMSCLRKGLWSKLGLSNFRKEGGRHGKEDNNSLKGKSSVNEEYKQAFRTKSFIEMCKKVEGRLKTRASFDQRHESSPSCPPLDQVHLSEDLLEPRQETLTSIFENSNRHHFLVNYFKISLEAGRICELILQNINQVHINCHTIKNAISLIDRVPDNTIWTQDEYNILYRNISSFAFSRNPFSSITPQKFLELHNSHIYLLHQLTSQCIKTKRRTKFIRFIKRAGLIVGCGALAIALLVLSMHCMVGAPGLIACSLGVLAMKKLKQDKQRKSKKIRGEGLQGQLDIAARGLYILINDFDTMSRLVQRLHDEMEHRKYVAEICVRKGKNEMFKEVVREFKMQEYSFVEQLEELEKQIYLCFLDINRSRRLLAQEMDNS